MMTWIMVSIVVLLLLIFLILDKIYWVLARIDDRLYEKFDEGRRKRLDDDRF